MFVCMCVSVSVYKYSMWLCLSVCVSIHGHTSITNAVRSSEYFQSILPLSAECVELDGDASSLPVIFEDVYAEQVITSLAAVANTLMHSQQQHNSSVELRRAAASDVSCSSRVRQSRLSHMSLASTTSSSSDIIRRSSKLRLRMRPESIRRAGDSLVATDEQDCTLVGYRKVDISCKEYRPTVELGTLTTDPKQSLVGSGVIMQPSLLFNAVSLPALHTTSTASSDVSICLTGSMPTLVANGDTSSESELTPYWQSQQGKAELVAQHSNEATAAITDDTHGYFVTTTGDDVDSTNVDFTLGSDLDAAVGIDLDMTVGKSLQRAVGNDLYMAMGIDLDTTVGSDLDMAASSDNVEPNETSSTAICDSEQHNTDVTSDSATAAVSQSVGVSAAADGDDDDARQSAASEDSRPASVPVLLDGKEQTYVDISAANALPVHSAADADNTTPSISTGVDAVTDTTGVDAVTEFLSSSAAASSLTHIDCSEECMDVTDSTSVTVNCGQSSTDIMKLSSVDEAVKSDLKQSAIDLNLQSSDSNDVTNDVNSCQSVSDITDELNVVIPSSCDSVSDDERYLSGQCTLLELISEGSGDVEQTWLAGCAFTGADIAQRLSETTQQAQESGVDVSDVDVTESTESTRHAADTTDRAIVSRHTVADKRLISVVSDETIQFIGAKEKLRKQLNYSGHFYRFALHCAFLTVCGTFLQVCAALCFSDCVCASLE